MADSRLTLIEQIHEEEDAKFLALAETASLPTIQKTFDLITRNAYRSTRFFKNNYKPRILIRTGEKIEKSLSGTDVLSI